MKRRILFVDDEQAILQLIQAIFRASGPEDWELVFATSGPEALELLGEQAFDVFLRRRGKSQAHRAVLSA